ncbi:hypothetical protein DFR70_13215 [Nocardia tenerifensis]|uniref:Uncharacterized protein n=1 Tax=Nocardia tenerifensis TaxID=228006 RepID=A0A318JRH7_9NOCA|nr:hypothetical protein [Nocardia tenerifensis]PXX52630.1 hypothetical protein DFR70_13215 [Nocardia tenerifensis]
MTSPDKSVPAGAYTGGSIRNLQKVTWDSARASILSNVSASFAGVEAIGSNLNSATNRALNTATSAQVGASAAQTTATSAQNTSAANASAIANLQTKQTQDQVGGASASDNFQSWDNTKWTVAQWKADGQAVPGIVVVTDQAGISKSGNTGTGADLAVWKTPLMTDAQSVSVVLGRPNQAGAFTGSGILLRAAADLSTFVMVQVGTGRILLQRGTFTGGSLSVTNWAEATGLSMGTGDTITVSASGAAYEVLVNGVGRLSYRDTAASSPVGANNRWVGFYSACNASSNWDGSKSFSFGFDLESFAAADTTSPPIVGTGWSLYRQNATAVAQSAGTARFGTVLDTARQSNNVNVLDLPSGRIQIIKSGWYTMSVGVHWSAAAGDGYSYNAVLWTAPSPDGVWKAIRGSADTSGSGGFVAAGTFVVFAAAGSVWAPGYYIPSARNMVGDTSGVYTYFDGTLCSYS